MILTGLVIVLMALSAAACSTGTSASMQEGAEQESVEQEDAESQEWPSLTPDGQPDIQGIWATGSGGGTMTLEAREYLAEQGMDSNVMSTSLLAETRPPPVRIAEGEPPPLNSAVVIDPEDRVLPYQPWARERRNEVLRNFGTPNPAQMDTQARGWPHGVPRIHAYTSHDGSIGGPFQILQPPGYVVFLYEINHEFRVVPLDDRPHPGEDIKLWMGDSRGRWEGNTLIIETTNHNDSTRLTIVGDFHSDEMVVTEEWEFFSQDRIEYRATIDDPQVYTAPWTIGMTLTRGLPGTELLEYAGVEGEQSELIMPR